MKEQTDEPIRILWTGGWDSTFRLLQLALSLRGRIQPYYLREKDRKTADHEMRTMDGIKSELFREYPGARDLVLPTLFHEVGDIGPDEEITESYKRIAESIHLGSQFDWLARFCFQHGIDSMELCIESGGTNKINRELKARFKPDEPALDEAYCDSDIYKVFRYFQFPLIDTTKLDMRKMAGELGFLDLLNRTWFCHSPVRRRPCGRCNPCVAVIGGGLGSRIPLAGHVRYHRRMLFDRVKLRLRKRPGVYRFLKRAKQSLG